MTDWRTSHGVKPPQCSGCPRSSRGVGFVPCDGPAEAPIRGVGRSPGPGEGRTGVPYSGGAGRLLNGILDRAGLSRGAVYITNLVKCFADGDPTDAEIAFCRAAYLDDELAGAGVVVAMGSLPARHLAGIDKVRRERGTVHPLVTPTLPTCGVGGAGTTTVVVTLEPAGLIWSKSENKNKGEQRDYLPIVIKDWIKAKRISVGSAQVRQDHVFVRHPTIGEIHQALGKIQGSYDLDIETSWYEDGGKTITHIGICPTPGYAISIRPSPAAREALDKVFENPDLVMGGHNVGQFDAPRLVEDGYRVRNKLFDTMLADHLIESDMGDFELESVCSRHLDYKPWKHLSSVDKALYNCFDVAYTSELRHVLSGELTRLGLTKLFWKHSMPMAPICRRMSDDGIRIDEERMLLAKMACESLATQHEAAIVAAVGSTFNIRSPAQLKNLLYDVMKLPVQLHRRTRKPTVDHHALEDLVDKGGGVLVQTILKIRQLEKLAGSFLSGKYTHADGRVHPAWMQHRAVTGRIQPQDPNVAQLPKGIVRSIFVPDTDDDIFIAGDFSQIEMRLSAWMSHCKTLLDRLAYYDAHPRDADGKRQDVHRLHANKFYKDVGLDETKRSLSKNMFYGIQYGQGARGLSVMYNVPEAYAASFIAFIFSEYPELKSWRNGLLNTIEERNYLRNPYGRIRWLWNRNFATEAFIFPPQSTGLDILLESTIELEERLPKPARIVLLCHDEIVVHCPAEQRDEVSRLMKEVMSRPREALDGFHIPVKLGAGSSYDDASKDEGLAGDWRRLRRTVR